MIENSKYLIILTLLSRLIALYSKTLYELYILCIILIYLIMSELVLSVGVQCIRWCVLVWSSLCIKLVSSSKTLVTVTPTMTPPLSLINYNNKYTDII